MPVQNFAGDYRFLSNFHPCTVVYDGETYVSTEHAYQAAKTLDPTNRQLIREAKTAAIAKRLGSRVPLRADWEAIKLGVMEDLLRQKFAPGTALREQLNAIEGEIVEGNNWHDVWWGCCSCGEHLGTGLNHLGKLLMKIRDGG